MANAARSRRRKILFALVLASVAALTFFWWARTDNPPAVHTVLATPLPGMRKDAHRPAGYPPRSVRTASVLPSQPPPTQRSSAAPPTPGVFNFAVMTPPSDTRTRQDREDERFATNEWFTEDDLHHPERYFELAEQMPELNRPEERRDTLAFFLAYRDKLTRDLAAAGATAESHEEILATIGRYDEAIARLRALVPRDR